MRSGVQGRRRKSRVLSKVGEMLATIVTVGWSSTRETWKYTFFNVLDPQRPDGWRRRHCIVHAKDVPAHIWTNGFVISGGDLSPQEVKSLFKEPIHVDRIMTLCRHDPARRGCEEYVSMANTMRLMSHHGIAPNLLYRVLPEMRFLLEAALQAESPEDKDYRTNTPDLPYQACPLFESLTMSLLDLLRSGTLKRGYVGIRVRRDLAPPNALWDEVLQTLVESWNFEHPRWNAAEREWIPLEEMPSHPTDVSYLPSEVPLYMQLQAQVQSPLPFLPGQQWRYSTS